MPRSARSLEDTVDESAGPMTRHPDNPGALTSLHLHRAIEGDMHSLGWVVARVTPLLLAQASHRLGPVLRTHYDPEDIVNDAWLVALPRLAELPARGGRHTPVLLRFLSSTVNHRIHNLVRKHIEGEPVVQAPRAATSADGAVEAHAADVSGAVTQAMRRELVEQITACIDELEPEDREVIMLRGIEQVSNRTTAMLLGQRPEAVSMRYSRALRKMRARLPGSVFDELAED